MFSDVNSQTAHWIVSMAPGATQMSIEIFSRQGTRTTGTVGWHVVAVAAGSGENADGAAGTTFNVYPVTVAGTAGQLTKQTEHMTSVYSADRLPYLRIRRLTSDTPASEHTAFERATIRFQ